MQTLAGKQGTRVNCIDSDCTEYRGGGRGLVVSASDDCEVRLWDTRSGTVTTVAKFFAPRADIAFGVRSSLCPHFV